MASYLIPAETKSVELEVKRSRFIAYVSHCKGPQEAKSFIQSLKIKYPDARHHCHAFIAGAPNDSNQYGFGDDGEPNGTAGMPIFKHLQHSDLGESIIVVIRYFGGTKLGTGGLARAYGDAAKAVLNDLKTKEFTVTEKVKLILPFALEAEVRKRISEIAGEVLEVTYSEQVQMIVDIPCGIELKAPYNVEQLSISTI